MKLFILTIVLDGMPQITWHLPIFNRLSADWHWYIIHGAADNVKDTGWCAKPEPRLSLDGTTEYLNSLRGHLRITILEQQLWPGKTAMCNAALRLINKPCLLLQCDCDEIWDPWAIDKLVEYFDSDSFHNCARFFMRYFVGQNIVTLGENSYGNNPGEWLRAFRFEPGMLFQKHEPPVLIPTNEEHCLIREFTREHFGVPDHYAYVFEHQVEFKETYYKYPDAVKHWRRLQAHPGPWPVKLRDFLPWVDDRAQADLLHR